MVCLPLGLGHVLEKARASGSRGGDAKCASPLGIKCPRGLGPLSFPAVGGGGRCPKRLAVLSTTQRQGGELCVPGKSPRMSVPQFPDIPPRGGGMEGLGGTRTVTSPWVAAGTQYPAKAAASSISSGPRVLSPPCGNRGRKTHRGKQHG